MTSRQGSVQIQEAIVRGLSRILTIGVALLSPLLTQIVSAEQETTKIKVVATLFPFADWAAKVGGDHVQVITMLKPGASPHTYELTTKDVKRMQGAKLLIFNGSGLDNWAETLAERAANKGLVTLALASHLPLAPMPTVIAEKAKSEKDADHDDHDHHPGEGHDHGSDTHTGCGMWLDPMRAVRMVDLIAEALSRVDPAHAADYQKNARDYWAQLDRLDRLYRTKLDPRKGGLIIFHNDFVYLFRRYGVDVYGIVEPYPGKEPSVDYIKKLTAMVSGKPLRYVLTEPQLSEKPAQVLAKQLGVPLVTVDPIGGVGVPGRDSYISLMTYNLHQLTDQGKK